MASIKTTSARKRKSLDFWTFWTGETVSNLGNSFTLFALPLLVFKLTGSALNLGIATAAAHLPYFLFGFLIGAWADRLNRKRMMILADLGQVLIIASIPALFLLGALTIWWIYMVVFVSSILKIFFDAGQFAALPSLVDQDELAVANGRIQASFFGASILGPLLAGGLIFVLPVPTLLFVDAGSFLVSAGMLSLITTNFNPVEKREQKSIWRDVAEGLVYLFRHPILRTIALLVLPVNFFSIILFSQLVLFTERQLGATDSQFGLINAVGSAGVVIAALLVGRILKRWSSTRMLLPLLALQGSAIVGMSFTSSLWLALPFWAVFLGSEQFFAICTFSLRQTIVPNQMLARVQTSNVVVGLSGVPLGSLAGGAIIHATGNVMGVFLGVGVVIILLSVVFSFTALGHPDRYLPKKEKQPQSEASGVAEG
ncbi:MAG TPA: MFS transporter [Ktedonobacteraceae bacterium]|nr:MFS transporter [Ktedonobacteraceae bacterium]